MSSLLRSINRAATRTLPQKLALHCSPQVKLFQAPLRASLPASSQRTLPVALYFSTMPTLNASTGTAGAAVGGGREYDPEIKDMASYIHNYKINSDLAVSCYPVAWVPKLTSNSRWKLPDTFF